MNWPKSDSEMEAEFRSDNREDTVPEIVLQLGDPSSAPVLTDIQSEIELPRIMASLGLEENIAPHNQDSDSVASGGLKLRRSQRKQAVPRIASGGVVKRRCSFRQDKRDSFKESDEDIIEFYKRFNEKFKRRETKSLETIYEEPKEKNGTVVLSGRKQRRYLCFGSFGSKAKLKERKFKIKSMLERCSPSEKKHFTVEDVKEHLAQSGLVSLPEL